MGIVCAYYTVFTALSIGMSTANVMSNKIWSSVDQHRLYFQTMDIIMKNARSALPTVKYGPIEEISSYELPQTSIDVIEKVASSLGIIYNSTMSKLTRETWTLDTRIDEDGNVLITHMTRPRVNSMSLQVPGMNPSQAFVYFNKVLKSIDTLPNRPSPSKLYVKSWNSVTQVSGGVVPVVYDRLSSEFIERNKVRAIFVGIANTRIMCTLISSTGKISHYKMTPATIGLLRDYTPKGMCAQVRESKLTFQPRGVTDSSKLSVSSYGAIEYGGTTNSVAPVYEALRISIVSMMESVDQSDFIRTLSTDVTIED